MASKPDTFHINHYAKLYLCVSAATLHLSIPDGCSLQFNWELHDKGHYTRVHSRELSVKPLIYKISATFMITTLFLKFMYWQSHHLSLYSLSVPCDPFLVVCWMYSLGLHLVLCLFIHHPFLMVCTRVSHSSVNSSMIPNRLSTVTPPVFTLRTLSEIFDIIIIFSW